MTTFGLFNRLNFLDPNNLSEDQIFKFEVRPPFNGRPDLIADEIYGVSILSWVLILFNNPRETLLWPENGSVIKYPSSIVVFSEIR